MKELSVETLRRAKSVFEEAEIRAEFDEVFFEITPDPSAPQCLYDEFFDWTRDFVRYTGPEPPDGFW